MKKRPTKIFLLLAGLVVLGTISTVLRTVTLLTAFDSDIGYYDERAAVTLINRIVSVATVIYGAVMVILMDRDTLPTPGRAPTVLKLSISLVLAFAFVMAAVLFGIVCISGATTIHYVTLFSLIMTAAYFVYRGTRRSDPASSPLNLLALAPIVCCFSIILIEVFNMYVPVNNPEKNCITFALTASALFTLEMAKSDAGAPSLKLWIFSAYASSFLCAYSAIPGLIASITDVTNLPTYIIYHFVIITMFLYSTTSLLDYVRLARTSASDDKSKSEEE